MIDGIVSLYTRSYPDTLIYMLQSTEYEITPYLKWYWRTGNFKTVAKRRTLEKTTAARLLLLALRTGIISQVVVGLLFVVLGARSHMLASVQLGVALLISYPVIWAHAVVLPLFAGDLFIRRPQHRRHIAHSRKLFREHKAIKIAVAGSYGKTTMKELLTTVLSEGKRVASTPGNKNVSISHAAFARRLKGDEDILVIEYGEGKPGDVKRFAAITKPDIAMITGVAPAHLDHYKTTSAAAKDIFSLAAVVPAEKVYVNGESPDAKSHTKPSQQAYSQKGVGEWKVSDISVAIDGTAFVMKKGKQVLRLQSKLIGAHQVGPLAAVAALADSLGLSKEQIEAGVAKTAPYEHRMQPYQLSRAWVIDDTYNGNIEGMRAGLAVLHDLSAKHKIYITPGLVEQGPENEAVHTRLGELIAAAKPDKVVLMKNSVTDWIAASMKKHHFHGELVLEDDPKRFYTNLDQFVAAGDLVVMQNDWTDNYN